LPQPVEPHFSVPIRSNDRKSMVEVNLGGFNQWMLIDTGATDLVVPLSIAKDLVEKGKADRLPDAEVTTADGSKHTAPVILIHHVSLGDHSIANVMAGVEPDDAEPLLGFPVLNLFGKFTIDTQNNLLTFG
jgi:clan AA aspartic protease (TIGR02281 family)